MNNTLLHALVSKAFLPAAGGEGYVQNALPLIIYPVHPGLYFPDHKMLLDTEKKVLPFLICRTPSERAF